MARIRAALRGPAAGVSGRSKLIERLQAVHAERRPAACLVCSNRKALKLMRECMEAVIADPVNGRNIGRVDVLELMQRQAGFTGSDLDHHLNNHDADLLRRWNAPRSL